MIKSSGVIIVADHYIPDTRGNAEEAKLVKITFDIVLFDDQSIEE